MQTAIVAGSNVDTDAVIRLSNECGRPEGEGRQEQAGRSEQFGRAARAGRERLRRMIARAPTKPPEAKAARDVVAAMDDARLFEHDREASFFSFFSPHPRDAFVVNRDGRTAEYISAGLLGIDATD